MSNLEDQIAKLCIDKYKSLKKTGKPCDSEWTVLAGIILQKDKDNLSVVALATGTKCLGANELKNSNIYNIGTRLSDSHAEVLAKRALWRYLYDQIDKLFSLKNSDVFVLINEKKIEFKSNILFHFYCSQTPCGDCAIIPKIESKKCGQDELPIKIRKLESNIEWNDNNLIVDEECKDVNDIHRTGAKCVDREEKQDYHLPGINYHVTGPLRTKPGRGDPTMSLSCSDKMAKWNALGIQGALLSLLIPKLQLKSIVIGGGCPFSLEAMERGLYKRFNIDCNPPKIIQASLPFMHMKNSTRKSPCPSSIIWCSVRSRNTEIAVEGRKQGSTKAKKGNNLLVTRKSLLEIFFKIIDKHPNFKELPTHPKKINYYNCKEWSIEYKKLWMNLQATNFKAWPKKPKYLQEFSL